MAAPVAHTGAGNVTTATAASATIVVPKPSNVADGDVLVAIVNHSITGATFDTVPAGWTQAALYNTVRATGIWTKPIPSAAAETATDYTWHATGGSGRIGGLILRVTGADGTNPVDAVGAGVGTGTSSIVAPQVTAVDDEALLIAAYSSYIASATPTTITKPAPMTNVGGWSTNGGASSSTTFLACHETLAASGGTGTRTATVAPAGSGAAAIMITLKPGTVDPPPAAPVAHTGAGDTSTVTVASSAVLRCPRPANTANGDVLIAVLFHRNSGPAFATSPPGWTAAPVSYTANGVLAMYWRHINHAATEPDHYTWRSPNGAARGAAVIFRVTGAAPPTASGGPIDSAGTATGSGSSTIVAPATTVAAPAALLVGCYSTTASTPTAPEISPPPGMAQAAAVPVVTGSAAAFLLVATQALAASGSSGTRTATVAPAASSAAGFLLTLAPAGHGTAQPPQLRGRLTGGVTHNAAKATAATAFAATVRFAWSTSPDLASPTYTAPVSPDRDGLAAAALTGLAPDTTYHWGVELDGTLNTTATSKFRTHPTPGAAASFSFAAGSCADTDTDHEVFDDIRTRTGPTGQPARFLAHLGDMHYQDIGVDDEAWALGCVLNVLASPRQQALYSTAPLAYTWSDHDFGGSNVAAASPAAAAVQAIYRRAFPTYTLPVDGVGIYQSWRIGRVLFVMTDGRSYMSPIADPDNAAKTKLGALQKAWWKSQVTTPGIGLVVWLHEDAWHNASTFTGDDTWSAYQTERAELAAHIQANAVPLLYIHGDIHALSHDDGSHVPGSFPLVSISPLDQTTFVGNGGLTSGHYPDPVSNSQHSQQYGWFDVIDDGTQIVVRYQGVSGGAVVQRVDMSWGIDRRIGWGTPL
ncbi:alkaline phosphatase D family protein [Spirillospora sp. CA-294931]|uniref:alkaline phosphatase D family protein n=1 Tax=Spirillospora sp. CA-294931 TaxID=3240042 RepID=UPI003D926516